MMRNQVLPVLCAATLSLSLSACSSGGSATDGATSSTPAAPPVTTATTEAAPPATGASTPASPSTTVTSTIVVTPGADPTSAGADPTSAGAGGSPAGGGGATSGGAPAAGGSAATAGAAAGTSTTACSAPRTLRPFDLGAKGPDVATLQCHLNRSGAHLTVDGVYGRRTADAYLDLAARATGQRTDTTLVDYLSWTIVLSQGTTPRLRRGDRGEDVRRLQRAVRAATAEELTDDGVFGERTERQVRTYQEYMGLAADGIVGPRTWAKLQAGGVLGE